MTYTISPGIAEHDLPQWLADARERFGTYGENAVNYKHADIAPIVMIAVVVGKEILLVRRGEHLSDAHGYWSLIDGFIDEIKPVGVIAQQELREELRLDISDISIAVAPSYTLNNPMEKRRYIVFPCLVELEE